MLTAVAAAVLLQVGAATQAAQSVRVEIGPLHRAEATVREGVPNPSLMELPLPPQASVLSGIELTPAPVPAGPAPTILALELDLEPFEITVLAAASEANPSFRRGFEQADGTHRKWIALVIAQHSAATFDAWTTRRVIERGGVEQNPLLRPFAASNGLYAAIQVSPVLYDYLGQRLRKSSSPRLRRLWWLPQTVSTAVHLWSGIHNLGVARRLGQ